MRKPNTSCCVCNTPVYRQPSTLNRNNNSYCSRICQNTVRKKKTYTFECKECQKTFEVAVWENNGKPRKFCSYACANKSRRGMKYTGGRNRSKVQERHA
jgi:endogenous inhibitor of DNA gyrase (YacG/DUF329 family)